MDTMRLLRKVNVDHLQVGWYQSTQQGQFLTPAFLDSQYTYQTTIEDSIVLVYGSFSFILIYQFYKRSANGTFLNLCIKIIMYMG